MRCSKLSRGKYAELGVFATRAATSRVDPIESESSFRSFGTECHSVSKERSGFLKVVPSAIGEGGVR